MQLCDAPGCEVWCGPYGQARQDIRSRIQEYDTAGAEAVLDAWPGSQSDQWDAPSDEDAVEAKRTHSHRGHLVARLFRALGQRQRLDQQAMGQFAKLCGFEGSDDAWAKEYKDLCHSEGWDENKGPALKDFEAFVNKPGTKGYCSDEELAQLLAALGAPLPRSVSQALRDHIVQVLFQELVDQVRSPDAAGPEVHLREIGLGKYSRLCGFQGNMAAWAKEYVALSKQRGFDSQVGLDIKAFQSLVDDPGSQGFSTDEELLAVLVTLRKPPGAAQRVEDPPNWSCRAPHVNPCTASVSID